MAQQQKHFTDSCSQDTFATFLEQANRILSEGLGPRC